MTDGFMAEKCLKYLALSARPEEASQLTVLAGQAAYSATYWEICRLSRRICSALLPLAFSMAAWPVTHNRGSSRESWKWAAPDIRYWREKTKARREEKLRNENWRAKAAEAWL